MGAVTATILMLFLLASPLARAEGEVALWGASALWDAEEWPRCGSEIPLTPALARTVVAEKMLAGFAGDRQMPAFLVGRFPAVDYGVVLFVRNGERWRAYALEEGAEVTGVFIARDRPSAVIFTQLVREARGNGFTIISTRDGFGTRACAELVGPDGVPPPDGLEFVDFNADARGRGTVIATLRLEGSPVRWYRVSTRRLDADWSPPQQIGGKARPVPGIYRRAPTSRLDALAKALLTAASQCR